MSNDRKALLEAVLFAAMSFVSICVAVWCEHNGYGMADLLGMR